MGLSEPRLVEILDEKPKLYVIEGMKGKVRQHNALTGTIDWVFDCLSVSGISCHDAVEADFRYGRSRMIHNETDDEIHFVAIFMAYIFLLSIHGFFSALHHQEMLSIMVIFLEKLLRLRLQNFRRYRHQHPQ